MSGRRFTVGYADPPWEYGDTRTGGSMQSGAAQEYPVLSLADIASCPVPAIMANSSVMFLWTTTPLKFSHGYPVLQAWGYDYKTTVYWDKEDYGMGRYFRGQMEELLVGVRNFAPFGCQLRNIIRCPSEGHSVKPEAFRQLIHAATGDPMTFRNIELFARRPSIGWTAIGFDLTGRDIREDVRLLAAGEPVSPGRTPQHASR